jgi:predicted DNA-binding transcriptional regulator YafY
MPGKRPDTLETVLMAIEMLQRIPRKGTISASQLHAQLKAAGIDRDLRTIQRQLEMLSEHFDIERDERDKPYGYRWLENARGLSLPNLNPQESLLLGLAEQHLKNLLPANLMKSMEGFFNQAKRNLTPEPKGRARLEREWMKKVRVISQTQPLLPPEIKAGVFETVSEALYRNRWLNVEYRNIEGKQTQADVMPLGLAQQGPVLYLVCRFRGYENERNLALHRLRAATISTITFEKPEGFDLKKYDDEGRFGLGEGKRIRLSFQTVRWLGEILKETKLAKDQEIRELEDGEYEVSATVADNVRLDTWLRGFSDVITQVKKASIDQERDES